MSRVELFRANKKYAHIHLKNFDVGFEIPVDPMREKYIVEEFAAQNYHYISHDFARSYLSIQRCGTIWVVNGREEKISFTISEKEAEYLLDRLRRLARAKEE